MSAATRTAVSSAIILAEARIQPTRSPPQWVLLSDPMVTTWSAPPRGAREASGAGAGTSRAMSAMVSSTTSQVPVRRVASSRRCRSSSGISEPVGLWKSGITYASLGTVWRSVDSAISMSQPASETAIDAVRSRACRRASSALA